MGHIASMVKWRIDSGPLNRIDAMKIPLHFYLEIESELCQVGKILEVIHGSAE